MTALFIAGATLCTGCFVEPTPARAPGPEPTPASGSTTAGEVATAPPDLQTAPSASAPDRHPPPLATAPGVCESVMKDAVASHARGGPVPAITVGQGERLCVEVQHQSEQITLAKVVSSTTDVEDTLVISLDGNKLTIENPFDELWLHYTLAPPPANGHACPVPANGTHVEALPANTARVTISDLHFKGQGTAGSALCM